MPNEEWRVPLEAAITTACESPLVIKWLVIAEVIGDDGERYLQMLSPPDSAIWDRIGMLDFKLEAERKRIRVVEDQD